MTGSNESTSRSARHSAAIRRQRSSSHFPAWGRYSARSSSWLEATCLPTPMPATSPPRPDSCPSHAIPGAALATCIDPSATAADCAGLSICPAQTSIVREGPNRDFYLKKRGEGSKHVQAVIALARRRAGVLWALLRDNRVFTPAPPVTQAP